MILRDDDDDYDLLCLINLCDEMFLYVNKLLDLFFKCVMKLRILICKLIRFV